MFTRKDLCRLIFPLIIEQTLAVTVGMADGIMVARVGIDAVSGVSLVDMINVLIINVFAALSTGGAIVTSQALGRKDQEEACRSGEQLILVSAIVGIGIMGLAILFRVPLLKLFFGKVTDEVMRNALIYFIISAFSYPFLAVYNSSAALFRSMGNSKLSMQISFVINMVNIMGNALFTMYFHFGVAGVAFSTLIARCLAAVVMIIFLRNPENEVHLIKPFRFKLNGKVIKRILHIGIPSALENSMFQLGRVLVVSIIAVFGTVHIGANAVANNLDAFGTLPGQAISLATITVVGQCIGAGDYKAAKHYTKVLLKIAYGCIIGLNIILLTGLPFLVSIYDLEPEVAELTKQLVLIHNGLAMVFWPLSFCLPNALRAANDVKFTMGISVFSMWTFRIGLSVVLAQGLGWGAIGVWWAMIIDWIFRDICFVIRFKQGKWLYKH